MRESLATSCCRLRRWTDVGAEMYDRQRGGEQRREEARRDNERDSIPLSASVHKGLHAGGKFIEWCGVCSI